MQPSTPVADRGSRPVESSKSAASSPVLSQPTPLAAQVTLFLCANSVRGGMVPPTGVRLRPSLPPVQWPFSVQEILLPCAGRLQPELILKAFEAGADLVCVIACDEGNCHYLEGSTRAGKRVAYVRLLLDEVGMSGERLLLFHLPGSACEDMNLGCTTGVSPVQDKHGQDARGAEELAGRLKSIAGDIAGKLKELGTNPLRQNSSPV